MPDHVDPDGALTETEAGTGGDETAPPPSDAVLVEDPWRKLRRFTEARIGLGRVGVSLPTREMLAFELAHAQARDAVHLPLDVDRLAEDLAASEPIAQLGEPIRLHSAAEDRATYLRHPGLGGQLNEASAERLREHAEAGEEAPELVFVIADGLSSFATQNNVVPFLEAFLGRFDGEVGAIAPPVIVEQGRVAIGDHAGEILGARAVLVLIGERPGLSSPDSLGLYFTWAPETGLHDARRNCISNVRDGGLSWDEAAKRAVYLLREAAKIDVSGVKLKDRSGGDEITSDDREKSFLAAPNRAEV